MIQITPQMRILLAIEAVDFRNHSECRIIPSPSAGWTDYSSDLQILVPCDSE